MRVSPDEIIDTLIAPLQQAFEDKGITVEFLAKEAKAELNAKQTKTVKLKGALKEKLPRGIKVGAITGIIETDEEGEVIGGTGETLVLINEINWSTRQKARMDIQKIRGDYPAEKHDVQLDERSLNAVLRGLPPGVRASVIAELEKDLLGKRD
jgi:hypothetical protein